jgi:AcrR family transcriptional regulator
MAKKVRIAPRKEAKQSRSKETVAALLQATAHILVRHGYDRASTNLIAKEAGVNIASLYQYFPSKEALVAAVIQQHLQAGFDLVDGALEVMMDAPVDAVVRGTVRSFFAMNATHAKLFRIFVEQIPRAPEWNPLVAFRNRFIEHLTTYLERHRAELRVEDPATAAFIATQTVEGVAAAALADRPEWLGKERFQREVADAVLAYLLRATEVRGQASDGSKRSRP